MMTKDIIVASKNPVKINAVRKAFKASFPESDVSVNGVSVASEVSDQPMSHKETLKGAENRARNAKLKQPEADFWVGIEGGIHEEEFGMQAFAWMVVLSPDKVGRAQTAVFYLPVEIAKLVKSGKELGEADDIVFGKSNSKQKAGAIGLLTDSLIDREAYYTHAMIMAFIPFKNSALYP